MGTIEYPDATKHLTLEDAMLCYENGLALAVHDGKDIVITVEWR